MVELSDKDIERLEAYWKQELDGAELKAIERRLQDDKAFRTAATEWEQIVKKGFSRSKEELTKRDDLRRQLQALEEETVAEGKRVPIRKWLLVAASFLILVWITYERFGAKRTSALVTSVEAPTRENSTLGDDRTPGEKAYDLKNFNEAWPLLKKNITSARDSLRLLYAGIAALKAGEAREASLMLETMVRSQEWSHLRDMSRYFLAIALVEQGQRQQALDLLNALVLEKGDYERQAAEAINLIENN